MGTYLWPGNFTQIISANNPQKPSTITGGAGKATAGRYLEGVYREAQP